LNLLRSGSIIVPIFFWVTSFDNLEKGGNPSPRKTAQTLLPPHLSQPKEPSLWLFYGLRTARANNSKTQGFQVELTREASSKTPWGFQWDQAALEEGHWVKAEMIHGV